MTHTFICWKCGSPIIDQPWPWSRLAECRSCGADLHVCRECVHYAPKLSRKCREERAEEPGSAETANFCDWFEPSSGAYRKPDAKTELAKAELDALFGGAAADASDNEALSPEERARRQLDELFK